MYVIYSYIYIYMYVCMYMSDPDNAGNSSLM